MLPPPSWSRSTRAGPGRTELVWPLPPRCILRQSECVGTRGPRSVGIAPGIGEEATGALGPKPAMCAHAALTTPPTPALGRARAKCVAVRDGVGTSLELMRHTHAADTLAAARLHGGVCLHRRAVQPGDRSPLRHDQPDPARCRGHRPSGGAADLPGRRVAELPRRHRRLGTPSSPFPLSTSWMRSGWLLTQRKEQT
jgi:hypothetical protein